MAEEEAPPPPDDLPPVVDIVFTTDIQEAEPGNDIRADSTGR